MVDGTIMKDGKFQQDKVMEAASSSEELNEEIASGQRCATCSFPKHQGRCMEMDDERIYRMFGKDSSEGINAPWLEES